MKRSVVVALAVAAMLIAIASPIAAQLDSVQRKAQIPFPFYVQDKELPAGTYLVGWVGGRLHLQSPDAHYTAWVMAFPVDGKKTPESSALQFRTYGNTKYLSRIWIAGRDTGYELLRTTTEIEAAKKSSGDLCATVRLDSIH